MVSPSWPECNRYDSLVVNSCRHDWFVRHYFPSFQVHARMQKCKNEIRTIARFCHISSNIGNCNLLFSGHAGCGSSSFYWLCSLAVVLQPWELAMGLASAATPLQFLLAFLPSIKNNPVDWAGDICNVFLFWSIVWQDFLESSWFNETLKTPLWVMIHLFFDQQTCEASLRVSKTEYGSQPL